MNNNTNTMDSNKEFNYYAKYFGFILGLYLSAKFIIFPMSITKPVLSILFMVLTLAVPIISVIMTRMYRDRILGGVISFSRSYFFNFFVFLYASLIVAITHYVYFRFFDNGYICDSYISVLDSISTENNEQSLGMVNNIKELKIAINMLRNESASSITLSILIVDAALGSFLASLVAPITMRSVKK